MYSSQFLTFIGFQNLSEDQHQLLEDLSQYIPENGMLSKPLDPHAEKLQTTVEQLEELLNKLSIAKIPLVAHHPDHFLFDYEPKEVKSAAHYQNALSNLGLMREDF